jgi:hypothetical protein
MTFEKIFKYYQPKNNQKYCNLNLKINEYDNKYKLNISFEKNYEDENSIKTENPFQYYNKQFHICTINDEEILKNDLTEKIINLIKSDTNILLNYSGITTPLEFILDLIIMLSLLKYN